MTAKPSSVLRGVSFVVPVRNGAASICVALESILAQADGRPMEVIVVLDQSEDQSEELVRRMAVERPIQVIDNAGRGAAAALNTGVRAAVHTIVCQVDQDVVLRPGWMRTLTAALDDPEVAAAQGYYATDLRAPLWARVMGRDLEQRYGAMQGVSTDHACTGNSAYQVDALRTVGLFDESLGYGYDNDMSYRLEDAGFRLVFCRDAISVHRWRETFGGYLLQQYGLGYGRLDLVARHPWRARGDAVSPSAMMAHAPLMLAAIAMLASAWAVPVGSTPWRALLTAGSTLLIALAFERLVAGVRAAWRFGDPAPLLFPMAHLARDVMWAAAIVTWLARRSLGRASLPSDSMRPRSARRVLLEIDRAPEEPGPDLRIIGVVPAHNEAANLRSVVADVADRHPGMEILVVDDGSTDETQAVLDRLRVRSIRFPERMGIGSAMRAGLRYASRLGFDIAVRLDGDGQHRAADIDRLIDPIRRGEADVALGSRYTTVAVRRDALTGLVQRPLARCLTALTGRRVTDPTSGFCAFGPRAMRVLGDHHPGGYPEPELQLFLSRNSLEVVEVAVQAKSRLSGRTSLTPGRMTAAGARVLLAMVIVPLRDTVEDAARD